MWTSDNTSSSAPRLHKIEAGAYFVPEQIDEVTTETVWRQVGEGENRRSQQQVYKQLQLMKETLNKK